jgi:hypothetical protein
MLTGHPIINDSIYNSLAFGPRRGAFGDYGDGRSIAEVACDVTAEHSLRQWILTDEASDGSKQELIVPDNADEVQKLAEVVGCEWVRCVHDRAGGHGLGGSWPIHTRPVLCRLQTNASCAHRSGDDDALALPQV